MSDTFLAHKEFKANGDSEFVENSLSKGVVDESLIVVEGEDKVRINGLCFEVYTHIVILSDQWLHPLPLLHRRYLGIPLRLGHRRDWASPVSFATMRGALANLGTAIGGKVLTDNEHEAMGGRQSFRGSRARPAHSIGRKPVLIIGDACFIIGAVLFCSSFHYIQLVVGRIVMGFGVGIAAVVCAVYIGELAPTKVRGRLVAIQSVMITGGQCVAYAVSAGLEDVHNGWRILFAIGIPFALVQGVAMHFLPESPRYDVVVGRQDRALKTLSNIYKTATPEEVALKLKAIQLSADVSNSLKVAHPSLLKRLQILVFTGRYFRCVLASTGLFIFQQLSGWNTLLYYSSTLFGAVGFNNSSAVGILVAGVNALMSVVSMFTMDPIGRRRIFLMGVPVMVIALAIASVAFYEMTKISDGQLVVEMANEYSKKYVGLMLGMMVLFIVGYAPSLGTIPYTSIELIPLEVRGMGSAIAISFQWAANTLLSCTYLSLMNAIGPAGSYGLYGGITFLGLIFIYFTYPEPSGLTLEETATLFDEGFGVKKAQRLRAAHKQAEQDHIIVA
ncbi:MFS transporter, SP family, arabinose:H+ symporter [Pseudohyphozyma bogoriensis]|nr:MFS transporter, SP family, arabinose:H+ symporter [Pseudohyphozyma bogoriensis]